MATIRASELTHRRLKEISKSTGQSIQNVLDTAVDEYRRKLFFDGVDQEYTILRENRALWEDELADRKLFEGSLADGLTDEVADETDLSA